MARAKSWVPQPDPFDDPAYEGAQNPFELAAKMFEQQNGVSVVDFYDDPVGFVDEFVDFGRAAKGTEPGLTEYQREIMHDVPTALRICVRGPHGLGKTTTNALTVLWFAVTRDVAGVDWKAVTTAGAWRQLEKYLWPEIRKWARRLRWDKLGMQPWREGKELMTLSLSLQYGEAFAVASSDKAKIEGVHADSVLYIFDESKAIDADIFDAAEGAFSGAVDTDFAVEDFSRGGGRRGIGPEGRGLEALAVATSTPGDPSGRFYDIHARKAGLEDWKVRHVRLDEVIKAGRISERWRRQREKQWGLKSGLYANRVLGEFHSSADDATIPLAWVEVAIERWYEWQRSGRRKSAGRCVYGVDVALGGADFTAIARRRGLVVEKLEKLVTADTLVVASAVQVRMGADDEGVVDAIGVGAGVLDQSRAAGLQVRGFTASQKSHRRDRSGQLGFLNRRAEMWWGMRERLDPAYGSEICLPDDDELIGELTAPKWWVTAGNKIQVESKDEVKKRLGRSTDTADAVLQTWMLTDDDDGPGQRASGLNRAVPYGGPADLDSYMPGGDTVPGGAVAFGTGYDAVRTYEWERDNL